MLPNKNEENTEANAVGTPLQDVDRLIENLIPKGLITPHIITLGLCESTKWKVREEEEKKTRKKFWKRQITVFALYLPCALTLTLLLMRHSRKNLKNLSDPSAITATQRLIYIPLVTVREAGGGGGGGGKRSKTAATEGSLPEIKEHKKLTLDETDPPKSPVPEKMPGEKKLEGKVAAIPIDQEDIPIGDYAGDISKIPSPGIGRAGDGIGSGQGNGIGSGQGSGFGPGSGGGTGGGEGGGIGRGMGPGVTLAEAEIISRPKPPPDTRARPLNRLIGFHKGKRISFAALCTSEGHIEKVELVQGVGDKVFEDLFLQYIQASWKYYAAIKIADEEMIKKFQAEYHRERQHYHIRDWITFTYTIR